MIACALLVLGKLFLPHFCADELAAICALSEVAERSPYLEIFRRLWRRRG